MANLNSTISLLNMIIKNTISKEKNHYPTDLFLNNYKIKKTNVLMLVLNKQTKNKFN